MISKFRLVGLSKPKSATCQGHDLFWPEVSLPQGRFNALWDYLKDNWDQKHMAVIEHDGFHQDGTPRHPKLINIELS